MIPSIVGSCTHRQQGARLYDERPTSNTSHALFKIQNNHTFLLQFSRLCAGSQSSVVAQISKCLSSPPVPELLLFMNEEHQDQLLCNISVSRLRNLKYLLSGPKLPLVFLLLRLQQPLAPLLNRLDFLTQPVVSVQLHGQPVLVLVF